MGAEIKAVSASGICDIREISDVRENSIREYALRRITDVVFDLQLLVDWDARRTLDADYPDFIGEVLFSFEPEWGFEFHESLRRLGGAASKRWIRLMSITDRQLRGYIACILSVSSAVLQASSRMLRLWRVS